MRTLYIALATMLIAACGTEPKAQEQTGNSKLVGQQIAAITPQPQLELDASSCDRAPAREIEVTNVGASGQKLVLERVDGTVEAHAIDGCAELFTGRGQGLANLRNKVGRMPLHGKVTLNKRGLVSGTYLIEPPLDCLQSSGTGVYAVLDGDCKK